MILLLGATGHLGQAFSAELRARRQPFMPLTRSAVDYTRFDVLFNFVRNTHPTFVINAAGYTGRSDAEVGDCEAHRAEAVQANTLLPQTVARVCYLTKTPWGHVSSGNIYSGAKVVQGGVEKLERDLNEPSLRQLFDSHPEQFHGFNEGNEPNSTFRSPPSTFYSGTKALAEEALRWFDQTFLWRTFQLFDEFDQPKNLLTRIQNSARVADSVTSLTQRGEFVRACLDLWERQAPFGPYNIVNPGAVSMRQLVELVKRVRKPARALEVSNDNPQTPGAGAPAPQSNCILDSSRLQSVGIKLTPVTEALERALTHWQQPPPNQEWLATSLKSPVVS